MESLITAFAIVWTTMLALDRRIFHKRRPRKKYRGTRTYVRRRYYGTGGARRLQNNLRRHM